LKKRNALQLYNSVGHDQLPVVWGDKTPRDVLTTEVWEKAAGLSMSSLDSSLWCNPPVAMTMALAAASLLQAIFSGGTTLIWAITLTVMGLTMFLDSLFLKGNLLLALSLDLFTPYRYKGALERVVHHEAGHFLNAYLLGSPIEGVSVNPWRSLENERFAKQDLITGVVHYDSVIGTDWSNKNRYNKSMDRQSIIFMSGIAAEALVYGSCNEAAGDEDNLIGLYIGDAKDSREIRNQARWAVLQAVLLLKHYKVCYDSLVKTMTQNENCTVGDCILAIEKAARQHKLGPIEPRTLEIIMAGNRDKEEGTDLLHWNLQQNQTASTL